MHIYYWSSNNLGDLFNIYLGLQNGFTSFRHISDGSSANNDGIFMIGSVLSLIANNNIIMGAGYKTSTNILSISKLANNKFVYVRGKYTAGLIGTEHNVLHFEPGLLLTKYVKSTDVRTNRFLFLSHYDQEAYLRSTNISNIESMRFSANDYRKIISNTPYTNIIEIKKIFEAKLSILTETDLIASSSLHGLVFAIALNKPFIWYTIVDEKTEPIFKFNDFFSLFELNVERLDICKSKLLCYADELTKLVSLPKDDYGNFVYDGELRKYIHYINPKVYESEMELFLSKLREYAPQN